jgi:hypothetical protein
VAETSVLNALPTGIRAGNRWRGNLQASNSFQSHPQSKPLRHQGKTMRELIAPAVLFVGAHIVILIVAAQMYALGQ